MTRNYTGPRRALIAALGTIAAFGGVLALSTPAKADPPRHAPAHGWRKKNEKKRVIVVRRDDRRDRHHDHRDAHRDRRRDDRDCDPRRDSRRDTRWAKGRDGKRPGSPRDLSGPRVGRRH